MNRLRTAVISGIVFSGIAAAQPVEPIYRNYAENDMRRDGVVSEREKLYDLFGEHIVDGSMYFELMNSDRYFYAGSLGDGDSVGTRYSNEFRRNSFHANLTSLCLSQDQVGKSKMMFMVGDRMQTRFTPLTLNKRNMSGIRWDLWSSGLKMTALLDRTRPGIISRGGFTGNSFVTYPRFNFSANESDENDWYEKSWNPNEAEQTGDWSQKTFFGDYDMLFAMHAENNIANIADVGITYINHHRTDIRQGEKFFSGSLPDAIVPDEIHFEIFDLTADDVDDAGAWLGDAAMIINGRRVNGPPSGIYKIESTNYEKSKKGEVIWTSKRYLIKTASALPCTADGDNGIVVTFRPQVQAMAMGIDTSDIRSVEFELGLAGNYRVFVASDKQTPQDDEHFGSDSLPVQLTVDEVAGQLADKATGYLDTKKKSEVYYGDYIAQSPHPVQSKDYTQNRRTVKYEFRTPVSNITYGVNFDGGIGNLKFQGEYAVSVEDAKYPFLDGEVRRINKNAGFLKLWYDLAGFADIHTDCYNIDADYRTGLGGFHVSPYFNSVQFGQVKEPMYLEYTRTLDNGYSLIDDNEDDDYYVENDRRKYPGGELGIPSSVQEFAYYNDGTVKGYAQGANANNTQSISRLLEKRVMLPTGLYRFYEDLDGVIDNRYDRNRNGILDYEEDFLLYTVDLPEFALEEDANNNGVFDLEEDDFYPDLPYSMGYVYTGNTAKSQGVRGITGDVSFKPLEHLDLKIGGTYEKSLDSDLDEREEATSGGVGVNRNLVLRGMYDVKLRSKGLAYYLGVDARRIYDGIRNDVIITHPRLLSTSDVDYTVQTDELRFFDAMTLKGVGGVEYKNISNFNFATRVAAGLERHYGHDTPLYITKSYVMDVADQAMPEVPLGFTYVTLYEEKDYYDKRGMFRSGYSQYEDLLSRSLYFVQKLDYTFKFTKEYRGRYSRYFNFLQQIQVVPQYQLLYINRGSDMSDPRDLIADDGSVADTVGLKLAWKDYRLFNNHIMYSVPIVKVLFKVGENTMLESGWQMMQASDLLFSEGSYRKNTIVVQLVNRTSIRGFDISIMLGGSSAAITHNVLRENPLLGIGASNDARSSTVFCKIFAGIKQ